MISATLQQALVASGFAKQYYELCAKHPFRNGTSQKCAHAEVLTALNGLGTVAKQKGPGRVYSITSPRLSELLDFSFIIQGAGTIIEPCLGFTEGGTRSGSNYAVLAFSASAEPGLPTPHPPYPRPAFLNLAEFSEVVAGALEIAAVVSSKVLAHDAQPFAAADGFAVR